MTYKRSQKRLRQFADLKVILSQSKQTDNALYQTVQEIIERLDQFGTETTSQIVSSGGGGGGVPGQDEVFIGPTDPGAAYELWYDTDEETSGLLAPHHVTHETGGADAVVNLAGEVITSGTIADARTSVNVLKHGGGYPGGTSTFLRADGTFSPASGGGGGDVVGPASSVDNSVALYSGVTGKLLKDDSKVTIDPAYGDINTPGRLIFNNDTSISRNYNGILAVQSVNPEFGYVRFGVWHTSGARFELTCDQYWATYDTPNTLYGAIIKASESAQIGLALSGGSGLQWLIQADGHIRPYSVDNLYDFGHPSYRIKDGYFGTSVKTPLVSSSGNLSLEAGGAYFVIQRVGGNNVMMVHLNGVIPGADNLFGFGDAASRWKDLFLGTSLSIGTNPAQTGAIRLANSQLIAARNDANTADITLAQAYLDVAYFGSANNQGTVVRGLYLTFESVVSPCGIYLYSTSFYPTVDAALDLGTTTNRWRNTILSSSISIGTNPASTGAIRLANNNFIAFRNAANTADVVALSVTPADLTYLNGTSAVHFRVNGTGYWLINTTGALRATTDNTVDIGAVAAGRPRNIYVAGFVRAAGLDTTPLNADNITSGTVPDAQLSVNVLKHTGGYPGGTTNFLRADGTFAAPPGGGGGSGDVVGPASAVDNNLASYNGTTGKLIKDSGVLTSKVAQNTEASGTIFIDRIPVYAANTGSLKMSPVSIGATGSVVYPGNIRQFFSPGAQTPGLNVGSITPDPTIPSNGDIWYNSSTNKFRGRQNGVNVDLVASGGGTGDVVGPASAVADNLASYNGTTGKLIKDSGILTSNVALRNAANVFTDNSPVQLSSARPKLMFQETDQPADQKRWNVVGETGTLLFEALNDAGTTVASPLILFRNGNVQVEGNLSAPYLAKTNQTNNFSESQFIAKVDPYLELKDMNQPVDGRIFRVFNNNQKLWLIGRNDADSITSGYLAIDRLGNTVCTGGITERSRTVAQGEWIDVPFNAGNFGIDAGTWSLSAGQIYVNKFTLIGKTMIWSLTTGAGTLSQASNNLIFVIPGGYTSKVAFQSSPVAQIVNNGVEKTGRIFTAGAGGATLNANCVPGASFTGSASIQFTVSFEIS